jgi:hypothetical protein
MNWFSFSDLLHTIHCKGHLVTFKLYWWRKTSGFFRAIFQVQSDTSIKQTTFHKLAWYLDYKLALLKEYRKNSKPLGEIQTRYTEGLALWSECPKCLIHKVKVYFYKMGLFTNDFLFVPVIHVSYIMTNNVSMIKQCLPYMLTGSKTPSATLNVNIMLQFSVFTGSKLSSAPPC